MKSVPGIYVIQNLLDGKVYVGSANNVRQRLTKHCRWLLRGVHYNSHLQRAFNRDRLFFFRLLEEVPDKSLLVAREQYWIDSYDSTQRANGYNRTSAGRVDMTADTRTKLSKSRKGKTWNEIYGETQAEQLRQQHSDRFSGPGNPAYGKPGFNLGKTMEEIAGEETAARMRDKTSQAHKGKIVSQETRDKISKTRKGTTRSESSKKKTSETLKNRYKATGSRTFEEIHGDNADDVRSKISEAVKLACLQGKGPQKLPPVQCEICGEPTPHRSRKTCSKSCLSEKHRRIRKAYYAN